MAKTKRTEARLLQYTLLYDKSGKLVTERIKTDISSLKQMFSKEEFNTLNTVLRECTQKLDSIHNYIENNLNARKMTE
tara:strand:+ start:93 stop:326 length:234 start_codon:yes stop_codon:yes gene_type:complete